jgi:23S rRNA (adenine2503-C2)-methyltransferase
MATSPAPLDFELPVPRVGDERVDLLSLDDAGLSALMTRLGEKAFRARQLFAWLHGKRVTSIAAMTDLSAALRQRLEAEAAIRRPTVDDVRIAADGTRKYQLLTFDGHVIESVWIPHASGPGRHALCISSQVGCAMGCRFCATAALKLTRHLSPGEIVGQVYAVLDELAANQPEDPPLPSSKMKHRYDSGDDDDVIDDDVIEADDDGGSDGVDGGDRGSAADRGDVRPGRPKRRIHNIVYMGMGEPLHNLDGVIGSVALLIHGQGLGMSPRRLTVSTSGVVSALPRLGAETSVHLAVSLNHTTDEGRAAIMPVNKRWDLETLLTACLDFPADRRRRITFEYVLLKDINDTDDDARRLGRLMARFQRGAQRSKVNLIPFNAHPLSPYGRPSDDRVDAFRRLLDAAHIENFVRTTRGLDIDAACGMLGAKKLEAARGALPVIA